MRICKTLGEDLWGFMRLWERICEDSQDFGKGFTMIHQDLLGFTGIHKTLGEDL